MEDTDLVATILRRLDEQEPILSAAAFPNEPFADVKAALDRLGSRSMVIYEQIERDEALLTSEGQSIVTDGSHEAKVFEAVKSAMGGLKITELPVRCPTVARAGVISGPGSRDI